MSELLLIGISHKTAPVALRERVAVPDAQLEEFLRRLAGDAEVHEAVAISTCNRMEIYLVVGDAVQAETAVLGLLARQAGIRPTELAEAIYAVRNCDAARHLYRVTAGLESMIVGEAEVQGQVKRAYELALGAGVTGPLTNRVFGAALATGKRVRDETAVSEGAASVPSVVAEAAVEAIGDLRERRAVILGTGEMAELTARALSARGAVPTFIANRRRDRAQAMAERFGGRVASLDDMPRELEGADVFVGSTASPHPIVSDDALRVVMEARGGRPLVLIDIAVPRDVDPVCAEIAGVRLYDIDDLQAVVSRNLKVRGNEAREAEGIIEEEIQRFAGWLGSLEALPTVAALREHGTDIVEGVLAENDGKWESLSERDRERVVAMARTVMSRLLHEPTLRMKHSGDGRTHARMQLARELFGLDESVTLEGEDAESPGEVRELRRRPQR